MIAFLMGMFFSTQAADHVKGNGKLSTKKITIDDFNAIKFDGVIDFNYEQSESTPHIEITVDENLHPYVNIDIQDRVHDRWIQRCQSRPFHQIHRQD